jgi:hypothetical protein
MGFGVSATSAEGAGGGGGYGPQVYEVWWAGVQCESRMIRKSDNHPNRERGGEKKEQKKDKK